MPAQTAFRWYDDTDVRRAEDPPAVTGGGAESRGVQSPLRGGDGKNFHFTVWFVTGRIFTSGFGLSSVKHLLVLSYTFFHIGEKPTFLGT